MLRLKILSSIAIADSLFIVCISNRSAGLGKYCMTRKIWSHKPHPAANYLIRKMHLFNFNMRGYSHNFQARWNASLEPVNAKVSHLGRWDCLLMHATSYLMPVFHTLSWKRELVHLVGISEVCTEIFTRWHENVPIWTVCSAYCDEKFWKCAYNKIIKWLIWHEYQAYAILSWYRLLFTGLSLFQCVSWKMCCLQCLSAML